VLSPGLSRVARSIACVTALVVLFAGCGTPSNLDETERVAFARACASLIERGMSDKTPPRIATVGGQQVNLDDPASFYAVLERLHGPSTFKFADPAHNADTARQPLDACKTEPVSTRSSSSK
jgi:hypothetical protein